MFEVIVRHLLTTPSIYKHIDHDTFLSLLLLSKSINTTIKGLFPYLLPHQTYHHLRVITNLSKLDRCIDTSNMGLGKTYSAVSVYMTLKFTKLIVFGPPLVYESWLKALAFFNYKNVDNFFEFHPYTDFRAKNKPFIDVVKEIGEDVYSLNQTWKDLIKTQKVFLIFDESHNLKNASAQSKMCAMLSRSAIRSPKSKVLFLSATPFDKKQHSVNVCRLLDIIGDEELANANFGNYQINSYGDLIHFCDTHKISINNEDRFINKDAAKHLYNIWSKNLVTCLSVEMRIPKNQLYNVKLYCYNTFYIVSSEILNEINKGVIQINKVLATFHISGGNILASVNLGLKTIESAKVSLFNRIIRTVLYESTTSKVIVMMNFIEPIEELKKLLEDYNPLVFVGDTPKKKRKEYIKQFQLPNNTHRLIIANLSILSEGVSLDDLDGGFPRTMFISPSYYFIRQQQATHRIFRSLTRSDANVNFVYVKDCEKEIDLLKKLQSKSSIVKDNLEHKGQSHMIGDYPKIIEGDE